MGQVIVIALSNKELEVVLHALVKERDIVVRTGGNQYGRMTIDELDMFISRFQSYQRVD